MIPLMIVSSLSLLVVHFFEPLSMEAKKLSVLLHATIETRDKLLLSRLNLADLIETNFSIISPTEKLSDLIKTIALSSRNLFPVVDHQGKLVGIIHLDKIRSIMFDTSKYEVVTISELMTMPTAVIEIDEALHDALVKFDQTNQWNLPVVDNGLYRGFLSKSTVLNRYRIELVES
jgi:CIC family chloride channel protein